LCYLKKCDFYGFLTWLSAFGDFVIDMALFWHCYVIVLSLFFALLIWGDVRFCPFWRLCQLAFFKFKIQSLEFKE